MAETLKHSLRAYILRDLQEYGALYADQLQAQLSPNEPGLFKIALERLIEVKFISRLSKTLEPAYEITPKGKIAFHAYLKEMVVHK